MKTMRKNLLVLTFLCFVSVQFVPVLAGGANEPLLQDKVKKEKVKKEKAPFDWEKTRPEKLSNNEDIDGYILFCDTVWGRVNTYRDSITFFRLDTSWRRETDGTEIKMIQIKDQNGELKNFSSTLLQYLQYIATGTGIVADAAMVNLKATSAATALLTNPLLAFSYGKCLKAGPLLSGLAINESKVIITKIKQQTADIKRIKGSAMDKSTDQAILLPRVDSDVLPPEDEILPLDMAELGTSAGEEAIDMKNLDELLLEKAD